MNRLQFHENGPNSPKFYVNSPAINIKICENLVLIFMRFRFDPLIIKQALRIENFFAIPQVGDFSFKHLIRDT